MNIDVIEITLLELNIPALQSNLYGNRKSSNVSKLYQEALATLLMLTYVCTFEATCQSYTCT